MKKVWIFGDSFSAPFVPLSGPWANPYVEYMGYTPKTCGELVAEHFGAECMNYAVGGNDNYSILQSICSNSDKIGRNDLLVVGWSDTARFRVVKDDGNWIGVLPGYSKDPTFGGISIKSLNEISINRLDHTRTYIGEVNSWISLLKSLYGDRIFNWKWAQAHDFLDAYFFYPSGTVADETGGIVNDQHFGEVGHKELSLVVIEKFKKIDKRII